MLLRNYAKDVSGFFTRVLSKITAVTALQYLTTDLLVKLNMHLCNSANGLHKLKRKETNTTTKKNINFAKN